jgi:hypothetical protein
MDSFDILLYVGYALVIFSAVAAIILPLINSLGNPSGLIKSGIGIVAIIIIYFVAYAFSGAEVTQEYAERGVGPELSKAVGGTLIMAYILLGISIVGILFTEVSKIFK